MDSNLTEKDLKAIKAAVDNMPRPTLGSPAYTEWLIKHNIMICGMNKNGSKSGSDSIEPAPLFPRESNGTTILLVMACSLLVIFLAGWKIVDLIKEYAP